MGSCITLVCNLRLQIGISWRDVKTTDAWVPSQIFWYNCSGVELGQQDFEKFPPNGSNRQPRLRITIRKKKEGFICGTHISLNSAAALLCHLPGKLSRGMWLLSAGGTMCVRVPGTQQAVNKVRVTPTWALAVKGVVAQGTSQTIFPPGLHHVTGSQDPWLQVSPREATEYQGLLWPLHPTQCVPMENVSQGGKLRALDVATSIPSHSFGVPTSYSPYTSSPWVLFMCFPLCLASSMDGRSFPAMFGSMAGSCARRGKRWDGGFD